MGSEATVGRSLGRGGVSIILIGCAHNLCQDTLHGCKDLLIAKAEHTDTLFTKKVTSLFIVLVFVIMAGAIKFYAKPMLWAVEVKNIGNDIPVGSNVLF